MAQTITEKEQRKLYKEQRRLEKQQHAALKSQSTSQEPISILCVRFGNKYGVEYVERFRNMVQRHCTVPHEVVCLTDDPKPIHGVRSIVQPNAGYKRGWWHKVHLFNPKLPLTGRILYMDLDIVICANIDKLTNVWKDDFIGIRDFNRKFHSNFKSLNSSVMAWNAGTQKFIWDKFQQNPAGAQSLHGDQDWIWRLSRDRIKFWPDAWIQSYKWEIRSRSELRMKNGVRQFATVRDDVQPHPECCVAVFHGDPNPAIVNDKFVKEHWK